jgi:hypothetical protein
VNQRLRTATLTRIARKAKAGFERGSPTESLFRV